MNGGVLCQFKRNRFYNLAAHGGDARDSLPAGTVYWKYGPAAGNVTPHWYQLPAAIAGNTAPSASPTAGWANDGMTANGTVVDQGGPDLGGGVASIPRLSEWGMIVLSGMLALGSLATLRRQRP